jgi:predicted CXXCH cytochrome family protein
MRAAAILFFSFVFFSIPVVSGKGIVHAGQALTVEKLANCEPFGVQTTVIERSESEIKEEEEKRNVYLNKFCIDCHEDVYTNLGGYAYKHLDIVPKYCASCHLKLTKEETTSEKENYKKIMGQIYDEEFLVPIGTLTDDRGICFKVRLTNKNGKSVESDFHLVIPSKVKAELTDDGTTPVISEIKITEFIIGIFDDVQISWKTDKFTESEVQYGKTEDYDEKVRDLNLLKNHEAFLKTLKHGSECNYRVVSTDIFGNATTSSNRTFYASVDKINVYSGSDPVSPPNVEEVGALKIGKDIFLYIKADQNVRYRIDYKLEKSDGDGKGETIEDSVLAHAKGLKTKKNVGIGSCRRCHKPQEQAEHPIDTRPSKKHADDLPLADGVMTCATCHNAHGSNNTYLLKKKESKLCDSCHTMGG